VTAYQLNSYLELIECLTIGLLTVPVLSSLVRARKSSTITRLLLSIVCYALKSLTAKSVCDALLELWQFTGCCSYVSSDLGTNFTSQLTREFERRIGCSPRFNSPWHPSSTGLAELAVGNVKTIVSKLAMDHPKQWHTYLPMVTWCLREVPNESTVHSLLGRVKVL